MAAGFGCILTAHQEEFLHMEGDWILEVPRAVPSPGGVRGKAGGGTLGWDKVGIGHGWDSVTLEGFPSLSGPGIL